MTLTAQQLVDVRYYCGYSVRGDLEYAPFRELAYSNVSYMGISLDGDSLGVGGRLAHLTPEEESRITGYFLTNLALREAELESATATLNVGSAGPFTRNPNEMPERERRFRSLRIALCRFLGFPPGSALRTGVIRT